VLGLDVKALRKLELLEGREDLSDNHRTIVTNLRNWYTDPAKHFFTSSQRRMIKNMHAIYIKPLTRAERLDAEIAQEAADHPFITDSERETCLSILGNRGANPRAWSPKQAKFLRDLSRRIAERTRQKKVRDDLEAALQANEVRPRAIPFCESIIAKFDERRQWTPVQMEHAEKILAGNEDPTDIDDDDD